MRFSTSKGIILPVPSFPGFREAGSGSSAEERPRCKTAGEDGGRQAICPSVSGSSCRSACITLLVSVSARQHLLADTGRHWQWQLSGNGLRTLACFLDLISLPPLVAWSRVVTGSCVAHTWVASGSYAYLLSFSITFLWPCHSLN